MIAKFVITGTGVAFHGGEMAANPTLGHGVTHSGDGVLPGLLVL